MDKSSSDITPAGRIARRRAQREAEAKAKAEEEQADETRAQELAADGKISIDQARGIVRASKGAIGKLIYGLVVVVIVAPLVFIVG